MRLVRVCMIALGLCCVGAPWASAQTVLPDSVLEHLRKRFTPPSLHGPHSTPVQQQEETRFSWWGYRHKELHVRKLIDELQKLTKISCCSGPYSGECRISEVDMSAKEVLIDGRRCKLGKDTKVVALDGLQDWEDGDRAVALVCASKSDGTSCGTAYCVGLKGGT